MIFKLLMSLWVALAVPAGPADAFFCTEQGAVLHYERRSAEDGELRWRHSESIERVRSVDGVQLIDVTSTIVAVSGKAPIKEPVRSQVRVLSDGSVEVNAAQAAEEAARQRFSAFNFTSSGGTSLLPADLAPGDVLKDIHARVSWAMVSLTIDYTERSVLRRERITVPAGTFDCIVVREHKLEKAPLHRRDRITLTWYAVGYGMIRHDTLFPDLTPETSEVLVEIIK